MTQAPDLQLKRCPCCRGEAERFVAVGIACTVCGLRLPPGDDAIERWNRRDAEDQAYQQGRHDESLAEYANAAERRRWAQHYR